jgi:Outer membrane protein beta-barrel domain
MGFVNSNRRFIYKTFNAKKNIMKKILVFLTVTLLLILNSNAQQPHFGIKGGVNISDLHFNDNTSTTSKTGVNLGVLAHIHTSRTWAIQPEVMYSLEGATDRVGDSKVTYNLNYLNVPVLLQYMFDNGFRFEAGPQLGFLLNAKTKTGNVTVTNKGFQSTAVSIPLGVGYLTSSGFGLDARYNFGLSNINTDKHGPTIQSNVFQLGIFYQVSNTKK